jgi:transposase
LAAHQILEVIPDRSAQAGQGYLEQLPTPEKVQVVVIDMSSAFRAAVGLCLPAAHIVVDKFHAIRVNEALDALRIRLQRASQDKDEGAC